MNRRSRLAYLISVLGLLVAAGCAGTAFPTLVPSASPTPVAEATATTASIVEATATMAPSPMATQTIATATATPVASSTPMATAVLSSTPTPTLTPTATATASPTPTETATATPSPTPSPTATATPGPTATPTDTERDFRQEMREFVQEISAYAKGQNPGFLIIPQNGQELLTLDGESTGPVADEYVAAIDGVGREDLFYGYDDDDVATPDEERDYMIGLLDVAEGLGVEALVTDYVSSTGRMDDSYEQNAARGYVSFAADERDLNNVPSFPSAPFNVNSDNVTSLAEARNFLYLIDPGEFNSRQAYLNALRGTSYDLLIIDAFYEDEPLTAGDVTNLRRKANGGTRLVVAYVSIGEAEGYRYYWDPDWGRESPPWLAGQNPDWPSNFKVRYWYPEWRTVVFGGAGSYVQRVLDAGFDGAYLDIIDAFEYFEDGG